MKSAHVLVWFRRNLRLHDNAALNAAVASGLPIACVWVSQRPSENHNTRQSLFHYQAAQELHTRLAAHHIPLYAVASDENLLPLAATLHAHTVITDEAYTEAEIRQDNHLWHNFDRAGIALQHANDRGILAKAPLMDTNGLPYTDFAAYKQAWLQAYSGQRPSETELPVQTGQNVPLFPAHTGAVLPAYQQGGETAALTQWHAFKQNLVHYPITQNFPARKTPASSMPICPQAAFHRACWPPKAWQTDISSGWTSLFSATTATSSPTTAAYPKQPMPPRCANTGATAKPVSPSSTPPSAASKPPATYILFSSSCAPTISATRSTSIPTKASRGQPPSKPAPTPRSTKPTGTSPHKTRPPSAMPTVRTKSTPTAATSAVTSPNWHTCRPPSFTHRGPPPTTSTHTATPFPRPSETYVHTKKPH